MGLRHPVHNFRCKIIADLTVENLCLVQEKKQVHLVGGGARGGGRGSAEEEEALRKRARQRLPVCGSSFNSKMTSRDASAPSPRSRVYTFENSWIYQCKRKFSRFVRGKVLKRQL